MLSLPAQPRPNNAVDPAARRAFALSSTRPTPKLRGAGGLNSEKTGQSVTPRPLERRVGLRAGTILRPPTEPKTKAGGPA